MNSHARSGHIQLRRKGGADGLNRKNLAKYNDSHADECDYKNNMSFLRDKKERETAISSGKMARRLINRKASLLEANTNKDHKKALSETPNDNVAPRGGKETIESMKQDYKKK